MDLMMCSRGIVNDFILSVLFWNLVQLTTSVHEQIFSEICNDRYSISLFVVDLASFRYDPDFGGSSFFRKLNCQL